MFQKEVSILIRHCFAFLYIFAQCQPLHANSTAPTRAKLIQYSWGGHDTPEYVAANMSHIESLPFDGIVLNDYAGRNLMHPDPAFRYNKPYWTYELVMSGFHPLHKNSFLKFRHNFAKLNMGFTTNPPDFFDDKGWNTIHKSAENYARALKDIGLKGIFLDNEIYTYQYWLYPDHVAHKSKSINAYSRKSRQRGKELMRAFMAGFPNIVVISLHSPSGCTAKTPRGVNDAIGISNCMYGAFGAGMLEAADRRGQFVDGGEAYHLRTPAEFSMSYNWRKKGLPLARPAFIPPPLRTNWSKKISLSFGIIDTPYPRVGGRPMTSAITRATVAAALCQADDYVWHYSEKRDWWAKASDAKEVPAVTEDWIRAIEMAQQDAQSCPVKEPESSK